jgi:hypothetical protein
VRAPVPEPRCAPRAALDQSPAALRRNARIVLAAVFRAMAVKHRENRRFLPFLGIDGGRIRRPSRGRGAAPPPPAAAPAAGEAGRNGHPQASRPAPGDPQHLGRK